MARFGIELQTVPASPSGPGVHNGGRGAAHGAVVGQGRGFLKLEGVSSKGGLEFAIRKVPKVVSGRSKIRARIFICFFFYRKTAR